MRKQIFFSYEEYNIILSKEDRITDSPYDPAITLLTKLGKAYSGVTQKYGDQVSVKKYGGDRISLKAGIEEVLESAFRDYIDIAGMPSLIDTFHSNKRIVKNVLKEYGKKPKRDWSCFWGEYYIKDIKKK